MAQPGLKVAFFNDFSGGLNNNQQRQNLRANETPDCLDVEFNARGGFVLRRGFKTTKNTALFSGAILGGQFATATEYLWGLLSDGGLFTWDGSTYTAVVTANKADMTRRVRGVAWDTKLYFANWVNAGSILMRTWDGTAFATLTNVVNDNYTAPAGGNAPLARLNAVHSGHMFWADTVEGGTRFRSRVRWSHPLQPADFATADYFDFNKDDQSNQVTALVPFKNMLLVFKQRTVWAIYGTDRSNFTPEMISQQAGAYNQESVTVSENYCYWWSTDGNVYQYDGRNAPVAIGERIRNVVLDGTVTPGGNHNVCWAEGRLYVSLATATSRLLYVYDPLISKIGAWTRFSFLPTSMFWWRRNTGTSAFLFFQASNANLLDTENTAQEQDETNGTSVPIAGYYKTAWFSADDTALMKRWRRPTVTVACKDAATLNVGVYHDFDESGANRTLTLDIAPISGGMVWGDPWGSLWSGTDPVYEFARLSSCGRSHAIQFKFYVTNHATKWWLDSYALPFLEKGYR